jgi:hypothetical protein
MSYRILFGLLSAGAIVVLNATDVAACVGSEKHRGAVERVRNEIAKERQRKAAEAHDITAADKTLADAKQTSAADVDKAKELKELKELTDEEARRRAVADRDSDVIGRDVPVAVDFSSLCSTAPRPLPSVGFRTNSAG